MTPTLEAQIRGLVDGWPAVTSKTSHGRPSWFVAGKNFLVLHPDGHHGNTFPHLWAAAPPGAQEERIAAFPDRFFRPPYVGHRGWVALRLDGEVPWDDVRALCAEAWRAVAPAKLSASAAPER